MGGSTQFNLICSTYSSKFRNNCRLPGLCLPRSGLGFNVATRRNLPIPFDRTGSEGEAIRGRVPALAMWLRNLAVLGQARVCVVKSSEDSRRVGISTARQGSGSSKAQPLFGRGRRGRASDPHCWPSAFGADHADRSKPIRKGLAALAGCR